MLTITQALNSLDATQEALTNAVDRLCASAAPLVADSDMAPGTLPVTQGCAVSVRIQEAQVRLENILAALEHLTRRVHDQLAEAAPEYDLAMPGRP